ncbi:MAG: hypothetical protein KAW92_10165 [Candidatus Cloacimonetes bacterium]|nr:hypothetical protein [Candidatus Cloacimonadota bacterium]
MSEKQFPISPKWVEEIEDSLNHRYPNPVLKNYLRRFGLPTFGTTRFLAERIIHAFLITEKLQGNEQKGLRRQFPMPIGQTLNVLQDQIKSLLKKGEKIPDFKDLVKYLDHIAKKGWQHIFFYRISSNRASHLNELRKKEYILESLNKLRCGTCYNRNRLIWDAKTPKLAEVRHRYDAGAGELLFKWVETRHWLQNIPGSVPPRHIPCQERSVNFFRVDLKDGAAEISIQKLHSFPQKKLQEELEIYCKEIRKLLNFDAYSLVPLEPTIKKLLSSRDMEIKFWSIRLASGGILEGTRDPNIFERLTLGLRNYSVRKVRGDWVNLDRIWGPQNVHTELDGKSNGLLITKHCDPLQMEFILRWLKGLKGERIKITEIKKLAKKREDLEPILRSIDRDLYQSEDKKVRANKLEALWYHIGLIQEAYTELVKISKKFKTSKEKGEIVLVYETPSGGLIGFLERAFGMFSNAQKRAIISLAFMIVIILLFWLNVWLFLPLVKESGKAFSIVTLTCFINIILILASAIPIVGKNAINDAIGLMGRIIEKFKKLFPFKKRAKRNE